MVSDPSLIVNDVIMKSLLMLKIIYVLANFVRRLTIYYAFFALREKFHGIRLLSKINNDGHNDVKIPYRVNYITLCVILAAISRAVWKL